MAVGDPARRGQDRGAGPRAVGNLSAPTRLRPAVAQPSPRLLPGFTSFVDASLENI